MMMEQIKRRDDNNSVQEEKQLIKKINLLSPIALERQITTNSSKWKAAKQSLVVSQFHNFKKRLTPNVNSDQPFFRLIKEAEIRVDQYDKELLGKVKQSQLMKKTVFSSAPGADPREHYIKNCSREIELILPLIDKVRGKTLCLQSYTLSKGHLRALASACEGFDSRLVNRFFFDNCGIDD